MIFCDHIVTFVTSVCFYFEHIPYIIANINKQVRAGVDNDIYIKCDIFLTASQYTTEKDPKVGSKIK